VSLFTREIGIDRKWGGRFRCPGGGGRFWSNAPAIYLYEKFGFQVEGHRKAAIFLNGIYLNDLIMGLVF
jgi:hypothetical protein